MVATLLAGVLLAGLLLPYALGVGLASNQLTTTLAQTPEQNFNGDIPLTSTITDIVGNPIAYVYRQNRTYRPLDQISKNLVVAITTVEDRRFLQHKGVDWLGTTRALLSNAQATDQSTQGGSTLTQQYVKNYMFLVVAKTPAEKAAAIAGTPVRKLREAKLALTLEQQLRNKNDILERYLNLVAFLPSTYGAEAAAERLFGVHAADLTLAQAAMMAGMVNNPNKYNPLDPDHVTDAKKRRDLVLKLMWQAGRFSDATYEKATAQPLGTEKGIKTPNGCLPAANSATNGFYCQYVLDYLRNSGMDDNEIADGGYTVKTWLDPKAMKAAKDGVDLNADPTAAANKSVASALAIVEPGSVRKVVALASNRPYGLDQAKGQTLQRLPTTFAPLGAGSTFKVFTAAAALQAGLGTSSRISSPPEYSSTISPAHAFHNAGNYPPSMSLQQALATSPNTAFVALEDQIGLQKVVEMAEALGMKGYTLDAGAVDRTFADTNSTFAQQIVAQKIASFTLGVTPVSPLELSNVGATLSSDGLWCPPTPVDTVLDRNNKVVNLKTTPCAQAIPAELARTLTDAMRDDLKNADGTAHAAASAAKWTRFAAGKTGTTQDYKSSAFLGYTPFYSGAVVTWDYLNRPKSICVDTKAPFALRGSCPTPQAMGETADKSSKGMSGGTVPAATWFSAMTPLHQPLDNAEFKPADPTYIAGQPNSQVPDVTNMSIDQAKVELTSKGFVPNPQIETQPTGASANVVTRQNPEFSALPGSTITLWYSAGGTTGG